MKITDEIVCFDIETTGFSAWEDDFVCGAASWMNVDEPKVWTSLEESITTVAGLGEFEGFIVTWNGENYRGGFDFPWLRSKCIQEGVEWKLAGVKHLDLLPLVRKYINTTHYVSEIPSRSSLRAADLKELAKVNGIDYQNKKQAYKALEELGEQADWLDYIEPEPKEDNSLQAVYQMMFDPECEEEYLDGGEVPKLYKWMKKISSVDEISMNDNAGAPQEFRNAWQKIKNHNRRDVERLKKIAEKVIPVIPDWEIERNINKL